MKTDEERKAQMRAYYIAHREKLLAYAKEYRKAHPEKFTYAGRAKSTEAKLKRAEWYRKYYQKNKERIRAYNKAWRESHPGYYTQKVKEWRQFNNEHI